jgi:hypothetical protein
MLEVTFCSAHSRCTRFSDVRWPAAFTWSAMNR